LGAPGGFIPGMVVIQAMILAGSGLVLGIVLFFPLMKFVEKFSPEVSVLTSPSQILAVILSVMIISLVSSILPNRKLRKVYPLEAFK
jgi:ABC-type antimicrobial peptide transport system permease subunit